MNSVAIHRVHDLKKPGAPLFDEMQKMLDPDKVLATVEKGAHS